LAQDRIGYSRQITFEEVRMRFVVAPVVVAICLLAASAPPVHAQVDSREGIALQNEIYQLRQELKSVEDQIARGGPVSRTQNYPPPPPQPQGVANDLLAQLLTRVDAMEEQVRQLRGRIDETQNQLQRQNDDLGKRIDDLAFQISSRGAQPSAPPSRPPSAPPPAYPSEGPAPTLLIPPPAPRPPPPPGPRTPEMALQEGNAAFARHDYPSAETAAREVLGNRTSPRAYDARLLLARSLYGEQQYAQAAIAFDDAYNSSRKGTHGQDALLGLAGSLSAINEKKAACDTLTRLRTEFPEPRPDVAASAAAAAQKTGCH
jgi:TolA-binding protein